jgi:hypothetical protein
LFTIFTSDERALTQVRGDRRRVGALVRRVTNRQEWGVRVTLDRIRPPVGPGAATRRRTAAVEAAAGARYLSQKKIQRDADVELAERASDTVAALYDRLASRSDSAKRRGISDLPAQGAKLLLDAAFLVPRTRAAQFRAAAGRAARALASDGYRVSVSGPWPPYSFIEENAP